MATEYRRNSFLVSDDPALLDTGAIHSFLVTAYWCEGIPRETLEKALAHSLSHGLYCEGRQIGLARAVTDRSTYAYLCDVYVLEGYRGQGLGRWLIECTLQHPDLQGLRRFALATRDAHELYRPLGFADLKAPSRHLEIARPGIYRGL